MSAVFPGSTSRAFLGWRTTASAMLPVWVGVLFLAPSAVRTTEGLQDLAFVVITLLTYGFGVLVVVPAFVFTIGKWLDRRTAPRGLRRSLIVFGLYGLGFGIALTLALGPSALTGVGVAATLLAPALTAVAGRLLVELKGSAWFYVIWGAFGLSMFAALALLGALVLGRLTA